MVKISEVEFWGILMDNKNSLWCVSQKGDGTVMIETQEKQILEKRGEEYFKCE